MASDDEQHAGRAKRLKAATHAAHDLLDKRIMAAAPFASRERYVGFLRVQQAFHRDIDALYDDASLDRLLPDLQGRRRLALIARDLADLEQGSACGDRPAPTFRSGGDVDVATALGWLYVAEGSNLGAAFLLKEAAKLGFSETFGARHLAGAPEGRGLHWRTFVAALDAVQLSEAEEARVIEAATAAFRQVQGYVEATMPTNAPALSVA